MINGSFRLVSHLIRNRPEHLTNGEFLVLITIADCVGETLHTRVSQKLIADRTGMSRQAVSRATGKLERLGIVKITRSGENQGRVNGYQFLVSEPTGYISEPVVDTSEPGRSSVYNIEDNNEENTNPIYSEDQVPKISGESVEQILGKVKDEQDYLLKVDPMTHIEDRYLKGGGVLKEGSREPMWKFLCYQAGAGKMVQSLSGKEKKYLKDLHKKTGADLAFVQVLIAVTQRWPLFTKYVTDQTGLPNAPKRPEIFYLYKWWNDALEFTATKVKGKPEKGKGKTGLIKPKF